MREGFKTLKTYRISEKDYQAFLDFCRERGLKPTQVIRGLIYKFTVKGMLKEIEGSDKS